MPRANVEVVRDQYSAVNERDFPRAMSHYAEDVELIVHSGIRAGTFSGREAVGRWFGDWFSTFDRDARFEFDQISELDDGSVLVVAHHHARGRASGVEVHGEFVWVYRLTRGKIVRVEEFSSPGEAVAAARPAG